MTTAERLIEIVSALNELRVPHLVMGGHAVRYYGYNRETTDYDLHIPVEAGKNLGELLGKTTLCAADSLSGCCSNARTREAAKRTCSRCKETHWKTDRVCARSSCVSSRVAYWNRGNYCTD